MRAKAEVCELCGSREHDWVDEETGRIKDHPPFTPVGIKCHGCAEIEAYRAAKYKDGLPGGVHVVLYPDDQVDADGRLIRPNSTE